MRGFRLTPLIISIIGAVLCVGATLGLYFGLIVPSNQKLASVQAAYLAVSQYSDVGLVAKAKEGLKSAQDAADAVDAQWNYIVRFKNPTIDVSNRFKAWMQWTSELEYDFAPRVESFLNHTGVQSLTKIAAPVPPADPNAVPTAMIAMPLGSISVFGSYNQILNHIARWNRFDRIVLVDKLALTGYSPFVTGTYTATEFIFPQNGDKPGPPVPSGTGGATAVPPPPGTDLQNQPGFGKKSPF